VNEFRYRRGRIIITRLQERYRVHQTLVRARIKFTVRRTSRAQGIHLERFPRLFPRDERNNHGVVFVDYSFFFSFHKLRFSARRIDPMAFDAPTKSARQASLNNIFKS